MVKSNSVKSRKLGPRSNKSVSWAPPSHTLQALEWLSLVEPRILLLLFLLVFRSGAGRDCSSSLFLRSQSGSRSSSNSPLWRWSRHSGSALQRDRSVSVVEGAWPALTWALLPRALHTAQAIHGLVRTVGGQVHTCPSAHVRFQTF